MLHHPERKMRLPSAIKFYALASLALGESSLTEICDHLVKNRHSWVGQTARNKDKWVFMVKERAVEGDRFETTEVRVNMRDRAAADLVSHESGIVIWRRRLTLLFTLTVSHCTAG